jgi:ADP-heptose:LPS heptosyltransferase
MYKISIKNIIFNKSARFYLHLKNYFSFFLFILVKPIISSKNISEENKTILFFNNGQIGDLLVSSLVLENEDLLPKTFKYVFLIKEEYFSLFKNYRGLFEIKTYNLSKYRFNIKYKLKLITELNNLGISKFFNLCAARGILTEELSYFINSNEKIALNKNSFYLNSQLLNYFNNFYNNLLFDKQINEYEKTIGLLNLLDIENSTVLNNGKLFDFEIKAKDYIVIAPFTSDMSRNWGIINYNKLIDIVSLKYNVVLLGSKKDTKKLNIGQNLRIENLIGKTSLIEAAKYIAESKVYIGNDSGLTHIALKFNKPIIALIGGGMWGRFFPFGNNNLQNFLSHKLNCFGCEWVCNFKVKFCINLLSIEDIQNKVDTIYSKLL